MGDLFRVDEIYIDRELKEEEELLLIKKVNELLRRVKATRERLVVLLCVAEVHQTEIHK